MSYFILMTPSFLAQVANGLLILILIYILIKNYDQFKKINFTFQLIIIALFAICLGIHGILHIGLEKVYGYNPLNYFFKEY